MGNSSTAPSARNAAEDAAEVRHDPRLLSDMTRACLSMALFFAWVDLGWNQGETTFGVPMNSSSSFHIALQIAVALSFLGLALSKSQRRRLTDRRCSPVGASVAVPCVLICWLGSWLRSDFLWVGAGAIAGLAQGLFMWGWLSYYRLGAGYTFIALSAASGMGYFTQLFALMLGDIPTKFASVVLPLLAALAFLADTRGPSAQEYPLARYGRHQHPTDRTAGIKPANLLLCRRDRILCDDRWLRAGCLSMGNDHAVLLPCGCSHRPRTLRVAVYHAIALYLHVYSANTHPAIRFEMASESDLLRILATGSLRHLMVCATRVALEYRHKRWRRPRLRVCPKRHRQCRRVLHPRSSGIPHRLGHDDRGVCHRADKVRKSIASHHR